jgi:hypothetical protein
VTWISDAALLRLREVGDWPDLSGTRYEIVERLGQGGMGTVYRAHDRELGRDVALKVLNLADPAGWTVARLRREARILASLEHPGLVPVHDLGTLPDGRLYYVMRLVRGQRLDEHVREERSLPARLKLFERICEAVAFAHAQGVLHRDLKPENVMVGPFGEVLVLDWGVAKRLGESDPPPPAEPGAGAGTERVTARGTVLGTPGYMAPEQARGAEAVDERADVYALGAMLCFLATVGLEAPAPRRVAAIAARATADDPAQRYPSASAVAAEVARFLAQEPVAAYREGPWERLGRLAVRYRTPLLLVAAYLVMRTLLALWMRA